MAGIREKRVPVFSRLPSFQNLGVKLGISIIVYFLTKSRILHKTYKIRTNSCKKTFCPYLPVAALAHDVHGARLDFLVCARKIQSEYVHHQHLHCTAY